MKIQALALVKKLVEVVVEVGLVVVHLFLAEVPMLVDAIVVVEVPLLG